MNLPADLTERLDLLEQVFENDPQGLWIVDPEGAPTAVNPVMCRLLGQEAPSLVGRSIFEFLASDDASLLSRCLGPNADGPRDADALVMSFDGQYRSLRRHVRALRRKNTQNASDAEGEITGWMITWTDAAVRQNVLRVTLTPDAERLVLLESFPGYIAAVDQDLRYVYVNMATAARMGRTPDEVIGRPLEEVLAGETLTTMRRDIAGRFSQPGKPVTFERPYVGRSGFPPLNLQVTQVAGPVGPFGAQTFYAYGIDIGDHQRARRDVELLLRRTNTAHRTA